MPFFSSKKCCTFSTKIVCIFVCEKRELEDDRPSLAATSM